MGYSTRSSLPKIFVSIIAIIFSVILFGSIVRIVFGSTEFSFAYFLDYISHAPIIDITYVDAFSITNDWGVMNPLRNFLNYFTSAFSFIAWLCKNLLNSLSYIFYFVKFLFVV